MNDDPLKYRHQHDSVRAAGELLADSWTMLVLREAFFGVRRFGHMQRNLGIARTVLASRLKRLVAEGLLERCAYRQDPVWYEYRLTAKGLDTYPIALAFMTWGDKYLAPAGPPTLLRHTTCDHDTQAILICSHCHQPLDPREIEPHPGPGADPDTNP
jgi:DNA-binding HxlR family transcriptional regulator